MGARASTFCKCHPNVKQSVKEEEEPSVYEVIRNRSNSRIIDMIALELAPVPEDSPEEVPIKSENSHTQLRRTPSDTNLTDFATEHASASNRDSEPDLIEHLTSESYTELECSKLSLKTKFSQQKLDGWEPNVTPKTVWKQFSLLGGLITLLGVCMLFLDLLYTTEITIPYSSGNECKKLREDIMQIILRGSSCKETCAHVSDGICSIEFTVPFHMNAPVYIYYEITNFHQNHRLYTKSKDDNELFGRIYDSEDVPIIPYGCSPAQLKDRDQKIHYPCGSLAGSMFSDVFTLKNGTGAEIPIDDSYISLTDFKTHKYGQPPGLDPLNYEQYKNGNFIREFTWPKHWSEKLWKEWFHSGGVKSPAFINWMQPHHSSTVRKLYGAIRGHVEGCAEDKVLCRGSYKFGIEYRFKVDSIKGTKSIILATTSIFGIRNLSRAITIISFGVILLSCSLLFFVTKSRGMKLSFFLNIFTSKRLKPNRVQNTTD